MKRTGSPVAGEVTWKIQEGIQAATRSKDLPLTDTQKGNRDFDPTTARNSL